jgi:hypothetical protein
VAVVVVDALPMVRILVGQTAAAMDVQLMMHALILLTQLMEEVVDTAVEVEVAMILAQIVMADQVAQATTQIV